jgi:hypothetical protein
MACRCPARLIKPVYDTRVRRTVGVGLALVIVFGARAATHDAERTQVVLTFARDGSFVLDVSNDPNWLKLRMEPFKNNFIDRVVLFVDGHEVRPTSAELIPGETVATYRLRGRMPLDARTLRWYYGLVVDPYPMTIRRADGRLQVEEIAGDAWSGTIDLGGQFQQPRIVDRVVPTVMVGLLLVPVVLRLFAGRFRLKLSTTEDTEDTEVKSYRVAT